MIQTNSKTNCMLHRAHVQHVISLVKTLSSHLCMSFRETVTSVENNENYNVRPKHVNYILLTFFDHASGHSALENNLYAMFGLSAAVANK